MTDLNELKRELQWCIENGNYGPRTGAALRWALEAINALPDASGAFQPSLSPATDAQVNGQGSYLFNNRKRKNRAHVWVEGDTACRMWSTGGLIQSLQGWTVSADREGRDLCQICESQCAPRLSSEVDGTKEDGEGDE